MEYRDREGSRGSWAASVACCIALTALFVLIYGGMNWLTSLRSDVGQLYFPWELRLIPLVPAMIVPYSSIDLLFLAAFFICRDRGELRALSLRLAMALLVAGTCFLIVPLKIGFVRPEIPGVFGWMFHTLHGLDKPFNLAPSLHVAIAIILAMVYVPKTRGLWRRLTIVWFILICVSTLLTWQHHVIDVVSGALLGIVCVGAVPHQLASKRRYFAPATAAEVRSASSVGSSVIEPL
jgi:membrane-associated phospholipid phosphatase